MILAASSIIFGLGDMNIVTIVFLGIGASLVANILSKFNTNLV